MRFLVTTHIVLPLQPNPLPVRWTVFRNSREHSLFQIPGEVARFDYLLLSVIFAIWSETLI
ncbi:hypothetical protein MPNT_140017 [Candidatus Methylacidithermus pantelleriae]|uniref:Uncharacterized protein n=1 Tax=Candidatus Methylacidithermus pantelleriae TaxID=2744239 RepID=A0A8J2FNL2_9BACT|nr:hypothetical protein MPNT_140017 [Candidatus Methylacidithermus pantelleriae]